MGTFGALLEYGCEERVTEHSSLGLTMVVGTTGVTCRLKLSRSSQTYLFPFHLSDEVMLQPVFYGTVVPLLGWLTVKKLILEPLESRRKVEVAMKKKEAVKEQVGKAREEAEASLRLMEERHRRILSEEEARNGLILEQCLYGLIVTEEGTLKDSLELSDSVIDVTKPLQCNVEGGRLVLWEGSKSSLPGVYDPVPGDSDKWILIRYSYQGVPHQMFCHDMDALKLPKTSHRVTE